MTNSFSTVDIAAKAYLTSMGLEENDKFETSRSNNNRNAMILHHVSLLSASQNFNTRYHYILPEAGS